jgi:hypothetical protein
MISNELIINIENSLSNLRELSLNTNYNKPDQRKYFFDTIIDIKNQYKEIEALLIGVPVTKVDPPAIRAYISRNIHPNQMEGWVAKLQKNVSRFINNNSIKLNDQWNFIKDQYVLLDVIIKIINGDAYFVGCTHATN